MGRADDLDQARARIEAEVAQAEAAGLRIRWMDRWVDTVTLTALRTCKFCSEPFLGVSGPKRFASMLFCSPEHETLFHRMNQAAARHRIAEAERARRRKCPRPDKDVWQTLEMADQVARVMRAQGKADDDPGALRGYECACGAFHVGNWFD